MQTAVFLMGPTASGKTDLAIELTKHFPCEIISVDSGMIYRGMDIGTAKPKPEQLILAPHRLINILDPSENYSVGEFRKDAIREIDEIFAKGKIPLLVGGTMMYFRALEEGISELPQANPEVRNKLALYASKYGLEKLYRQLQQIDPEAAARISIADSQRIQRALEVYELSGLTLTELCKMNPPKPFPYKMLKLIIAPKDRELLHARIALRLEFMMAEGFISEVEELYSRKDLHKDMASIRTVGYRQIWQYLLGTISYDEMLIQTLSVTRQLVKRQFTWVKSWKQTYWFDSCDNEFVNKMLKFIEEKMIF